MKPSKMYLIISIVCVNMTIFEQLSISAQERKTVLTTEEEIGNWLQLKTDDPVALEPYQRLASLYAIGLRNTEKSLEVCLEGLKYHPHDVMLNQIAMYNYFRLGEHDIGLVYYRLLSLLGGDNFNIPRNVFASMEQAMDTGLLLEFCKAYLTLNPKDKILNEKIADIYISKRMFAAAKVHLEMLTEELGKGIPVTGDLLAKLGTCEFNLGNYDEALDYMTKAKQSGVDIPDIFFARIRERLADSTRMNQDLKPDAVDGAEGKRTRD